MSTTNSLSRRNKTLALIGLVLAILFIPPIFGKVLAMDEVNAYDKRWLVPISAILFTLSIVWFALSGRIKRKLSTSYMVLIILITLEVLTRIGVLIFGSERDMMLLRERYNMTFNNGMGMEGHPFRQYTGKTSFKHFNNYGFPDDDFNVPRPGNVIRIACVGESTTTDGLTKFIGKYLNANRSELKVRYETMCFAHDYYTSAHSLVTFLNTVLEFKPQYLLVHHGLTEAYVRNSLGGQFKSDYSHALKSWERPWIPDAVLIRGSILYRHFRFVTHNKPRWWGLESYLEKPRTKEPYSKFENPSELEPFRRNIESMIAVAQANGIKVILTTLPHTTEWQTPHYHDFAGNVDQCNTIVREIAEKHKDDVLFIDLDSKLTGSNQLFTKIVDVNDKGRQKKTELIGKQILEHSTGMVNEIAQLPLEQCKQDLINASMNAMHDNIDWRKDIERKADEKGVTYNEMLLLDAIHIYNQDSIRFAR